MGQRCTGKREKHALTRGASKGRCRSTRLFEDESYWIIGHETPFRVSVASILPSLFRDFFYFLFLARGQEQGSSGSILGDEDY